MSYDDRVSSGGQQRQQQQQHQYREYNDNTLTSNSRPSSANNFYNNGTESSSSRNDSRASMGAERENSHEGSSSREGEYRSHYAGGVQGGSDSMTSIQSSARQQRLSMSVNSVREKERERELNRMSGSLNGNNGNGATREGNGYNQQQQPPGPSRSFATSPLSANDSTPPLDVRRLSGRPLSYLPPSQQQQQQSQQNQQQMRPSPSRQPSQTDQQQQQQQSRASPTKQMSLLDQQQQRSRQSSPLPAQSVFGNEPFHDMNRAITLLKSSKFYAEGFLMKRVEVAADGKGHPQSQEARWQKWFVQLSGTIMSTWNAQEMEEAAREDRTVPPQYLNLSDAFVHPSSPSPKDQSSPGKFQFTMNSAGLNRIIFCAPSPAALSMWINAIRLAGWERSRCNEIYTGTLLGTKEPAGGWAGYENGLMSSGKGNKFEGWLKARFPGDTEWRRVWTVVLKGTDSSESIVSVKKTNRMSLLSFGKKKETEVVIDDLPGGGALATVAFYSTNKLTKKEQPLCTLQHLFYAAALYPESEKLVEVSSLFKVEGTFLNPADGFKNGWGVGGRAEKQGMALLMADEGGCSTMLNWIVGLADVFKLYGRPRGFSFDPRDPSSLYFAMPIGPHRERQFLDRELVDHLEINESRPRAIRAVFHNILFDRMRNIRTAAASPAPRAEQQPNRDQLFNGNNSSTNSVPRTAQVLPAIGELHLDPLDDNPELSPDGSPIMDRRLNDAIRYSDSEGGYNDDQRQSHEIAPPPPATQSFRTGPFSPPLVSIDTNSSINFSRPGTSRSQLVSPSPIESTPSSLAYEMTSPTPISFAPSPSEYSTTTTLPRSNSQQISMQESSSTRSPGAPNTPLPELPSPVTYNDSAPAGSAEDYRRRRSQAAEIENSSPGVRSRTQTEQEDENELEEVGGAAAALAMIGGLGELEESRHSPLPPALSPKTPTGLDSAIVLQQQQQQRQDIQRTPRPEPAQIDTSARKIPNSSSTYDMSQDAAIHSDLLAALDFVDRRDRSDTVSSVVWSPSSSENPSTLPSPATREPVIIGPPPRRVIGPGKSNQLLDSRLPPPVPFVPPTISPTGVEPSRKTVESNEPTSYPSSFAKNTRSEERTAAAQVAQLEQQAAATRPGKSSNGKGKQRAWQDSDDDEEEEEDDLESDNDGREIPLHHPQPVSPFNATTIQQQGRYSQIPPASFGAPRDTYYSTVNEPAFDQQSQYYDDQSERGGTPPPASGMVPSMSKYGLLHAGLLDKADRSARAVEAQAREVGGPLVSLPSKPPPPQTGLVGAITSHQREKERTGGVGKALTEQQRDRRLAEQRQKQLDDLQREQLMQQQQQMQFQQQQMQQQQFYNPMMNPMMFGGGGMQSPGGMGMMNGQQMDPAMMQQAMMAAQQAFMQAMMQQYQQPSPNNTLIGQQQQNFMPQYFPQQQQQQQQQPYPSSSPLPQSPSLQQSFANAPYQRSSQDYEERATTPVRSAGFGAPERRDSPLRRTESPRRQDDQ